MTDFLKNKTPAEVYNGLLCLESFNTGLDDTLSTIKAGDGDSTLIKVSTEQTEIDFGEGKAIKPEIKNASFTYLLHSAVNGASYSVSMLAGNIQKIALTGNLTNLIITDFPSTGIAGIIRLIISRGTYTITNWPFTSKWQGGTALDLSTTTASTESIVEFMTIDGGTSWYARTLAISMA